MDLGTGILFFLICLMMISGFIGQGEIFLALFLISSIYGIAYHAVIKDKQSQENEEWKRKGGAPVRSFLARITHMLKRAEKCCEYFITFQAQDGSTKELAVDEQSYLLYDVGKAGELICMHDFFLSFTPAGCYRPAVQLQNAQCVQVKIVHKRRQDSFFSCCITFDTPQHSGLKMRVSTQCYEACCVGQTIWLICRNGTFLGFEQAAEEILDPALFERNIPQQEPDGNGQMNGL